ncbi:ATP-dependent DNA ligase LigA [Halorubellus sp. PRR65]|uniref:ATP-dependent DNA ligase LigA n=1 Tax=Halorubellus sp. PRR65 TaxID=3098148 RepID=UPI002B2599BE|nr:ATP-dependent DNA ligase LigA [Halorubellus sp. PRR65]
MEFAAFADRARAIEETDADLAVVAAVAELFAEADADDLETLARFVQGRAFPAWDDRKLDVGPSLCHEALARAAGPNVTAADVEDRLAEVGEIGAVAASLDLDGQQGLSAFGAGGGDDLTVADVHDAFVAIATATGSGSAGAKADHLFGLFNRASPAEARFVARLVLGEMRIGVGDGTVRDAIAAAFLAEDDDDEDGDVETGSSEDEDEEAGPDGAQLTLSALGDGADAGDHESDEDADDADTDGDGADVDGEAADPDADDGFGRPPADAVAAVGRALQVSNDAGRVAAVARDAGRDGLADVHLDVGRPVGAMLAQAGTITDAVEAWDAVAVETKYDGARVQVHHDPDGDTRLFSRNMEDVTEALPELVAFVRERVDVPVILDGEALAVDDDGDPLPFQRVLERFRRKHDVARAAEDVAVELRAFDCLHHGGEDLLDAPLTERQARLERVLEDGVSESFLTSDADAIGAFEAEVLDAGHEGIMLKDPASTYSAGKRGQEWLKRKPDVETLDVVVTGAEWGEGRRANVFGTFEVGVRAPERADESGNAGGYATVGKVATGITDAELDALTERLRAHVTTETGQTVRFEPAVVFEVGYEEIQASPTYDSGYALRFPRYVAVREDKAPADADTLERVEALADD